MRHEGSGASRRHRGQRLVDGQRAASRAARAPANPASLTIRAVLARIEAPSVRTAIRASSQGVSSGPATPASVGLGDGSFHGGAGHVAGERVGLGNRHAHEDRSSEAEAQMAGDEACRGVDVRDGFGCGDAGRAGVEPGQVGLADGDDRHAARLEVLERGRDVEDRLRARRTRRPSASARAPRGPTRCRRWRRSAAVAPALDPPVRRGRPAHRVRRDGRHRSRRSRRP